MKKYCDSPIGTLLITATDGAITGLDLVRNTEPLACDDCADQADCAVVSACELQLGEYFRGERKSFDLPVRARGTVFQEAVWRALAAIPYGETRTYGEIAAAVGKPNASRAVGGANHCNPVMIVVPCHRVIGSDGTLTGFGGGLPAKQFLLALELQNSPAKV